VMSNTIQKDLVSGGAGRSWTDEPYALRDLLEGRRAPTALRWPR
jgi:hypothetical protein